MMANFGGSMRIKSLLQAVPIIGALVVLTGGLAVAVDKPSEPTASKPQAGTDAARAVVQQFYAWYMAVQPPNNGDQVEYAVKQKPSLFSQELKTKLHADFEAASKSPGELVGLDFDPFLNTQDDPERMVVGNATMKGSDCYVDVFRASKAGKKESNKPAVIPELAQKNGKWVFVNFHYPADGSSKDYDLLGTLKQLAADRIKYPVTPVKKGK